MPGRLIAIGVAAVLLAVVACGEETAPTLLQGETADASELRAPAVARDGLHPTPTPAVVGRPDEPLGFPVDPDMLIGWVDYDTVGRPIRWGQGPGAETYSRDFQPGVEPYSANAGGWNCRVHVAFEGRPAVDWYIPVGTPVRATMNGRATLYAITTTNAFAYYGAARAPYVGYPSSDAVVSPFPGPGGGKGIFVEIRNEKYVTESAHLELGPTLQVVPDGSFLPGVSPDADLEKEFASMRSYLDITPLAEWDVMRGEVIGFSGDTGYSEGPHLHYTVRRAGGGGLLCPTTEAGFPDSGWLFR